MTDFPWKLLPRERREPTYEKDADGSDIVRVPLAGDPDPRTGQPGVAVLDKDSFEELCRGPSAMTDQWTLNRSGGGKYYVRAGDPFVTIARVLMRAGKKQRVLHRDGDVCNLRKSNLEFKRHRDDRLRRARVPSRRRKAPDPAKVEAATAVVKDFLRTGRVTRKTVSAVITLDRSIQHEETTNGQQCSPLDAAAASARAALEASNPLQPITPAPPSPANEPRTQH